MACVDLPAFPLQLLLREHPDWNEQPAVVVDHDKPQGVIQWANERARRSRILPGMRYATGLSIDPDLRAGVVTEGSVALAIERVTEQLWTLTPGVEASEEMPGVFWLEAGGLVPLFPSFARWAECVHEALGELSIEARVAVGFSRFGTFAGAKSRSTIVFGSVAEEKRFGRSVPIDHLDFAPRLRDTLDKLGIRNLGQFIDLPADGLRRRFGDHAHALHRLAVGEEWDRLEARAPELPLAREFLLDHPEGDVERLIAHLELHLRSLRSVVDARFQRIADLTIELELEDGETRRDELRPSEPTLDLDQLLHLVRLRWETAVFATGVVEIRLEVTAVGGTVQQESLFSAASLGGVEGRDRSAADRALAQVRAQLGDAAVACLSVEEGHLPEAGFAWRPFDRWPEAEPKEVELRPLIRRMHLAPIPLPPRSQHEPDGWLLAQLSDGPVEEVIGPYRIEGGWWVREVSRAYYYVRTRNGRWLWIYHDRVRRRWYIQGEVE